MSGVDLIMTERIRQIEQEGWTAEHDDEHSDGSIAVAGACYALNAASNLTSESLRASRWFATACTHWPWDSESFKAKDPLRDLVRAGALIAAEIDRLQRRKK